jgi:hypothetical protein
VLVVRVDDLIIRGYFRARHRARVSTEHALDDGRAKIRLEPYAYRRDLASAHWGTHTLVVVTGRPLAILRIADALCRKARTRTPGQLARDLYDATIDNPLIEASWTGGPGR